MNLTAHLHQLPHCHLQSPSRIHEFRFYRRRRLKLYPNRTIRNQFGSFDVNLFETLSSRFPSLNSLESLAPALGIASGVTLYLSRLKKDSGKGFDVGDWVFFTSPTPFNRFVLLRCPSVSFEGSELLEDVNEKLVKEDRHFVRLNSGKIKGRDGEGGSDLEKKLEYQRLCVGTEDGGVISLDWPSNLDLEKEHGLDTTLLLVPGTTEGSMDKNLKTFVFEALKRGCFPIVMNPRGCSGSPLTTARLFTAADSDDVCTAIQFINKARPWTTLMGVGWGYGANMLTKYLAEVGERTPLTAATCIDNPFDLEEATRFSPPIDQTLMDGLRDILQSNKELFQGKGKGFDVEKALMANSVRDFDKAISMVSYGFEAVEDFYSESSTRNVVGNVKIPILFIQNDDGIAPLFSIPRSLIAENPFTSLLLCSSLPSSVAANGRSAVSWCQHFTIEWLTAVELALLKGRHPLLKDVDVTINPPKGLALVEGRSSDKSGEVNRLLDFSRSNAFPVYTIKDMLQESDTADSIRLKSRQDSKGNSKRDDQELKEVDNGALQQSSSPEEELVREAETPGETTGGQMLQTSQVVMNMLDITMPGILTDEKKKKVLTAVDQGESLINALQNAVPENVREKLTAALSGIVHTQGTNLKFDRILDVGQMSNVAAGVESKIQKSISAEGMNEDHSSDQMNISENMADDLDTSKPGMEMPSSEPKSYFNPSEPSQKSDNLGQYQSTSSQGGDTSGSEKDSNEMGNNENGVETSANTINENRETLDPSQGEKKGGTVEEIINEHKESNGQIAQLVTNDDNNIQRNQDKTLDPSTDQDKPPSGLMTEEAQSPLGSSSEAQPIEREGNDNQKMDSKIVLPVLDQSKSVVSDSSPPTFSVSQALDALTGMDDSTQVAVNSVFGVIENMITQLEEDANDENGVKDTTNVKDKNVDSVSKNHHDIDDHVMENMEESKSDVSAQVDPPRGLPASNHHENILGSQHSEEPSQNSISGNTNVMGNSQASNTVNNADMEKNEKIYQNVSSKLLADNLDRLRYANSIPLYVTTKPYGSSINNEYLHNYAFSKIPTKSLDVDTTTSLLFDYFPEEGQWKLLEQPGNIGNSIGDIGIRDSSDRKIHSHSFAKTDGGDDDDGIIEPTYVVLDNENRQEPIGECDKIDNMNEKGEIGDDRSVELMQFVKNVLLNCLKVEVGRRLSAADMKVTESSLARDLEQVADAVSLAIGHDKEHNWFSEDTFHNMDFTSEKVGTLQGDQVIMAISSAIQDTNYLRRVLPVGVVVGSSLAALRKYFTVVTAHNNGPREVLTLDGKECGERNHPKVRVKEIDQMPGEKSDQDTSLDRSRIREGGKAESKNLNTDNVMVGAVTAALGASALLVHQQGLHKGNETAEHSSNSLKERCNNQKELFTLEEEISERNENNIVTSLAEKAMSVAGPVVPTKGDGEVDQERLVAMLADLGQKGGMLKLVGKVALLWGGLRGAMSLTDKLISFLRIAERPLFQRILGFVSMVLVLWSPVVVPLLPTLVQSWTTKTTSRIAELACIVGLYTAVMILIVMWGKRIRGYESPLQQYGLDLTSSQKIHNFLKGLVGGVMLVLSIHFVNVLLGCVNLSWPSSLPSSPLDAITWLKVYGNLFMLAGQGIVTATAVVLVEELVFRSWLPEEIESDLGYHQGIIISGLAFSLLQRSPRAIPGLWLISLALAGAKQRSEGSLSIPIGLRAGMMASSFILQRYGFLTYKANFPLWVTGTHPFEPLSGVVGLSFSLVLALILYPRMPQRKKFKRRIRDQTVFSSKEYS